jgi:hypothetical protein
MTKPTEIFGSPEFWTEMRRRRALHDRQCAVNQPEYAGGPCTCGLIDGSVYDPLAVTNAQG